MKTAKRLRLIRQERGWTQRGLASRAGISRMTVRRLERGERARPLTLSKLADALGLSQDEITDERQTP